MNITDITTITLPLVDLHENTGQIEGVHANPRVLRDAQYRALVKSLKEDNLTGALPLKVYDNNGEWVVLGGNMRLKALQEIGAKEVACIVVPKDTPSDKLNKIIIIDNSTFGEWDMDMLANEWDENDLKDWGVDVPSFEEKAGESDNYSRKIECPIYEPTQEEKPEISTLVDVAKYNELCAEIEKANVSDEQKNFLKLAAARHIVFDYAQIAELYAHEEPEMQRLMENSALVIIDFKKAIENGFVKMTSKIEGLIPPQR